MFSVFKVLFWRALGAEWTRAPVPAGHASYAYVERIEPCGNRIVDMGGGTIADARADGTDLAFGVGEHFCIGTHLARLEARVMFEAILERRQDLELAGPVARLRSNLIDGVKHIPLKFRGQ